MVLLHQIVNTMTDPLVITLTLVVVGLVLISRGLKAGGGRLKVGRRIVWLAVVLAILMGFNPVIEVSAWWLEKDYPPVRVEDLPKADAIVLLGGGVSGVPKGSSAPYPNLQEGADRVWHAARIWKSSNLPPSTFNLQPPSTSNLLIYCTCPDVSRSTPPFLRDLGVDEKCIVALDGPWNTEAEAKEIERRLGGRSEVGGGRGKRTRVYLVTSAAHMKRAVRIFQKYAPSVEVVPAATDHILVDNPETEITWRYFVPNMGAFCRFNALLHEYLGLVRYW